MIDSENAAKAWIATLPGFTQDAMARLNAFVDMLHVENGRQNLVAASSLSQVWQRHIADSLQLLLYVPPGTSPIWLDLGSGAGFPGLAIAAFDPKIPVTLVESRARRVTWLKEAASALSLPQVEVKGCRLEQVPARPYQIISARAFAPLTSLVDLASRFSTAETTWILPKGKSAAQEVLSLTKWHHTFHVEQSLTGSDAGVIVGNVAGRKGARS
jgi:16S rRNA (guanine527-N7)-methyltransferase